MNNFLTNNLFTCSLADGGMMNKYSNGGEISKYLSSRKEMFQDDAKTLTKKDVVDFIPISKDSDKKYWVKDTTTGFSYYIFRGQLRKNNATGGIFKTTVITTDTLKNEHRYKIFEEELYDYEKEMEVALKYELDPNIKKTNWQIIVKKFSEIYFVVGEYWDYYSENEISSNQVKAQERVWEFDRYSPYPRTLNWKEAEKKFKESLSQEQQDSIEILYSRDEYADWEEHDKEKYSSTITVRKRVKMADSGMMKEQTKNMQETINNLKDLIANKDYEDENTLKEWQETIDSLQALLDQQSANGGMMAKGGGIDRYTIHLYYGGEMPNKTVKNVTMEEAKRLSMGAEHYELIDSKGNEIEIEYAGGGGVDDDSDDDGIDYNSISDLKAELQRLIRWKYQYGSKGADSKIQQLEQRIEYLKSNAQKSDGGMMAKGGMLVYKVNDVAVENFLKQYPVVKSRMEAIVSRNRNIKRGYAEFLKLLNRNEEMFGGREEVVSSTSFGTKTFYKYDWNGVSGWAEVYQYINEKI